MSSVVLVGNPESPWGAGSWGLRRASNGLEHVCFTRTGTVRFTEMNRRVGGAPGGYALLMGGLPTTPGM